jgi:hypothetical protein
MLLDKAQELVQLCDTKRNKQKFADNLNAFKTKQTQITDAVTTIKPSIEALRAFRKRNMLLSLDAASKVNDILNLIAEAETNFNQDPDSILDFKAGILKSKIDAIKKSLEQQLKECWQNYLIEKMPSTNNEVLNVMAKFNEFKHTVDEIRSYDIDIKSVNYPKDDIEFTMLEGKIEQLNLCWKAVKSENLSEQVLQFIKDAADPNKGASLELLTDEVKDWINKYNISNLLKIRLT